MTTIDRTAIESALAARLGAVPTTTLDVAETVLDASETSAVRRTGITYWHAEHGTLADATADADGRHAASKVKATFAVRAYGESFVVVPAWSCNTDSVLYRTGP